MARKADIQYIHHSYVYGTAARKLAVDQPPSRAPLPLFEPEMTEPDRKVEIRVDPLSVAATLCAVVLVVMMVVSLFQFGAAYQQNVALQEYVYILRNENVKLEQAYQENVDMAEVEAQALALGMVPADQAPTMYISGVVPAEPAAPTFWENVGLVFSELFAGANV